jgi:hypothetical protein
VAYGITRGNAAAWREAPNAVAQGVKDLTPWPIALGLRTLHWRLLPSWATAAVYSFAKCVCGVCGVCSGVGCGPRVGPYLPTTANRSCAAERVLSVKPGGSWVGCGPRVLGPTYLPRRIDRVRPKGFCQSNQKKKKNSKKTAKRDVRFRFFTASTSANLISSGWICCFFLKLERICYAIQMSVTSSSVSCTFMLTFDAHMCYARCDHLSPLTPILLHTCQVFKQVDF